MSITLLRIIRWRKLALILAIVAIASAIVAFTACISLGTFHTISNLLTTDTGNVMIIYGANARSPQTSVIPLSVYNELMSMEGVEAVSPEVVSIALLPNDKPIVVRGIDPSSLKDFVEFKVLDGAFIDGERYFEAVVGVDASKRLGLKTGNKVLLRSILTGSFIEVEIIGVYESKTSLDDEMLVPLQVAQWLRGLPPNAVSMMRVKTSGGLLPRENLSGAVGGGGAVEGQASKASRIISLLFSVSPGAMASRCVARGAVESMQEFISREIKLNEASFWSIVILVFSGSVLTINFASTLFVLDHAKEISIIKSIGGFRRMHIMILLIVLASSLLAGLTGSLIGYIMSKFLSENGLLIAGTYTIKPLMNVGILLASAGLASIVSLLSTKTALDSLKA
jgi:ABC-type antimicrobial peptide transport system permease subunit